MGQVSTIGGYCQLFTAFTIFLKWKLRNLRSRSWKFCTSFVSCFLSAPWVNKFSFSYNFTVLVSLYLQIFLYFLHPNSVSSFLSLFTYCFPVFIANSVFLLHLQSYLFLTFFWLIICLLLSALLPSSPNNPLILRFFLTFSAFSYVEPLIFSKLYSYT